MIDDAITELAPLVGVREACVAVGRPQANHYRRHRQSPAPTRLRRARKPQPRALAPAERAAEDRTGMGPYGTTTQSSDSRRIVRSRYRG